MYEVGEKLIIEYCAGKKEYSIADVDNGPSNYYKQILYTECQHEITIDLNDRVYVRKIEEKQ